MSIGKYINIAYLGNNNPFKFKRGVENVIDSQAKCITLGVKYYIFFDDKQSVFRWNNFICIGIKNNIFKYIILNYIIFILKKSKHIIIHSHGPVKTAMLLYKTDILTVHDAIYYQRKGAKQKGAIIFYLIEKIAYLKSKKLHFISKYAMKQALINDKQKNKSTIIYNTSPLEGSNQILSSQILMENDKFNLFAVRGIQSRTRIDLLIDFADYIKDKLIDNKKIYIYIAGKGDLLEYYKNEIIKRGLSNIQLLGFVPDDILINYYKKCDMVILPCEHAEGFGLPIIEGYMYNKPVIGSNKCAVPEIIYSNDYLFDNDVESILNTLYKTYKNSCNFKLFYMEKYSFETYKKNMINIYKELSE